MAGMAIFATRGAVHVFDADRAREFVQNARKKNMALIARKIAVKIASQPPRDSKAAIYTPLHVHLWHVLRAIMVLIAKIHVT